MTHPHPPPTFVTTAAPLPPRVSSLPPPPTLAPRAAPHARPAATPSFPRTRRVAAQLNDALGKLPAPVAGSAAVEALASEGMLPDALQLLDAMTHEGAKLSGRAFAILVDAAVLANDPGPQLAMVFDAARKNGSAAKYQTVTVKQPDGDQWPPLPDSSRRRDILFAVIFIFLAGTGVSLEVIDPIIHHSTFFPTALLIFIGGWLGADRYLGDGVVSGAVSAGLRRLLSDDPVRECRVDAAVYLVAYLMGLPYVCFRPNVAQTVKGHPIVRQNLLAEGLAADDDVDAALLDKYLVWIMAGTAAEAEIDQTIIESDPSRVRSLLVEAKLDGWLAPECSLAHDLSSRWALAEAQRLLEQHRAIHVELTKRMVDGATAGECALVIETGLQLQAGDQESVAVPA